MNSKSGEFIIAAAAGLLVLMGGMGILTHRHNVIVAKEGGVAVDFTAFKGKREVVTENPKATYAVIAASIATTIAADKIHIGDNYTTITGGKQ